MGKKRIVKKAGEEGEAKTPSSSISKERTITCFICVCMASQIIAFLMAWVASFQPQTEVQRRLHCKN